jgi:hypothetical protein
MTDVHLHVHVDGIIELADQISGLRTTGAQILGVVQQIDTRSIRMSEATDAVKVTLENVRGDVVHLSAVATTNVEQVTALTASVADLTAQVATLTSGQDAAVAAAVAPLQATLDDVNAGVAEVAATAAEIDAMTPDVAPVVEQPPVI